MTRFAKIVATLGPGSSEEGILTEMVKAGLDVARLNFSHGDHEGHAAHDQTDPPYLTKVGKPVTILQDLQGPKLRIGNLVNGPIELTSGQEVALSSMENPEDLPDDITFIP